MYNDALPVSQGGDIDPVLAAPLAQRQARDDTLAPQGFDPSNSRLVFQFPEANPNSDEGEQVVGLFADGYLLGRTVLPLPWNLACARSPDGRRIAYSALPEREGQAGSALRWFNLSEPDKVYQLSTGEGINEFAFADDSRRVAVFVPGADELASGVYLFNIASGERELLWETTDARGLTWSPDGLYLAWIHFPTDLSTPQLVVLHLGTKQVIYQDDYLAVAPEGSMVAEWRMPFPARSCACCLPFLCSWLPRK